MLINRFFLLTFSVRFMFALRVSLRTNRANAFRRPRYRRINASRIMVCGPVTIHVADRRFIGRLAAAYGPDGTPPRFSFTASNYRLEAAA